MITKRNLKDTPDKQFSLYTDGACQPNPGQGGWAYLLISSTRHIQHSGKEVDTTNNRMELLAAIKGLQMFKIIQNQSGVDSPITLFSDSQYIVKGIESWSKKWKKNGWLRKGQNQKPISNIDLWQELRQLADDTGVKCCHIRGHSGHRFNEQVDKMAVKAINV